MNDDRNALRFEEIVAAWLLFKPFVMVAAFLWSWLAEGNDLTSERKRKKSILLMKKRFH